MTRKERRQRRSDDVSEALFYQLDTCRERAGLTAMILADEEGLCVASSGERGLCEELAAHVAIVGDRISQFSGALFSSQVVWDIDLDRLDTHGTNLFICAVGGSHAGRASEVKQSRRGVSRILAA